MNWRRGGAVWAATAVIAGGMSSMAMAQAQLDAGAHTDPAAAAESGLETGAEPETDAESGVGADAGTGTEKNPEAVPLGRTRPAPALAAPSAQSPGSTPSGPRLAPPRLVHSPAPEYPTEALEDGRPTSVVLHVVIDASGQVRTAHVDHPAG